MWISCDKKVVYPASTNSTLNNNSSTKTPTDTTNCDWGFNGLKFTSCGAGDISCSMDTFSITVGTGVLGDYSSTFNITFSAKNTGVYILSNKNFGTYNFDNYQVYYFSYYVTDSIHTGVLTLTKLDTINHYISGTYSYACEEQRPSVNGGIDSVKNGFFTDFKWK